MKLVAGVDLETTGLDVKEDRILEIAILLYDLDTRERKLTFVKRVNPQRKIDPKAQAVHGISAEQLIGCPTFDAVAPDVVKLFKASQLVVAHNGFDFDFPMLVHELKRCGLEAPIRDIEDTITATWACSDGKKPRLGELAWALDVPYDESLAHGAQYDVDVMMQCYFRAMDKGFFKRPGGAA